MTSDRLSSRMRELEEALECGDRITSEAVKILSECATKLSVYSKKTAPVRDRARTLITASRNIKQAREKCEQIYTSLDVSRRLQGTIQRGPGDDMVAFLNAVDELEAASSVLWSNQSLNCVKEALDHSERLWNDAMAACESDYVLTLTNGSRILSRTILAEAVENGCIEVVTASSIPRLKVLSTAMLKGAHQRVSHVYTDLRVHVMEQMLTDMGLHVGAFPELQSTNLEQLEEKIKRWIEMASALPLVLRAEKAVIVQIFAESEVDRIFAQAVEVDMIRIASFGRDILKTSHPPHKLFSLLDMHQTLGTVLTRLEDVVSKTQCRTKYDDLRELLKEIELSSCELFDAFQNSVKEDASKKEVQDGTVHPLTAGVLKFFKRLFKHDNFMKVLYGSTASNQQHMQFQIGNHMSSSMVRILMVLQDNLETKSRAYKSKALAHLFMMNNVNFIVTSVEQSKAIELLGQPWVDRQKTIVDDYSHQYYTVTWEPVMSAVDVTIDDIHQSNAQRRKAAIKERFKKFNSAVEEIHGTQMEWTIPDPNLKKTMREKVTQSLIPAYRQFRETFENVNFTKNADKYLKYRAEDVERMIREDLYENKIQFKEQRRLIL